ncbi:MAG: FAD-dependent oxidoreductase, partial [Acidobacteriota bacterium]|nr:FAD-dependent oxidoreductase [Acidobacteriota bacterium]
IVGGGPAGLTAANDLALRGVKVTIFEAQERLGGMLRYGIPAWRLPKDVLDREIHSILALGVEVCTRARILTPKALLEPGFEFGGEACDPFDAVFVATGAWGPKKLDVLGETARGVWQALNFLYVVNSGGTPPIGKNIVVLGGNDLALDAARAALRLPGVQTVHLACLESWTEMPADPDEIEAAFQEGIVIHNGLGPTGFEKTNGRAVAVRFRACTSVYDEHRSFDPIYDDAMVSTLAADTIIVAAGRIADAGVYDLETRPGGRVFVYPENQATSVRGVFAGGDVVLGPASMAEAMAEGHRAAEAIYKYVNTSRVDKGGATDNPAADNRSSNIAPNPDPDAEPKERAEMSTASRTGRLKPDMSEINLGYDKSQALYEAGRCLECGLCSGCMECVKACPVGAVRHDERPEELTLSVGGVIVTGDASPEERKRLAASGASSMVDTTGALGAEPSGEFPADAEDLAGALVRGGAAAAEILRQLAPKVRPEAAALVIGGGVAAMTAAQYLADQGAQVHLVEKTDRLGGMLRGRHATLDMENVSEYMHALEKTVRTHPNVHLYMNAELTQVSGRVGDFSSVLNVGGKEVSLHHAVTIVATGGRDRQTEQYLIGRNPAVITQSSLGRMLADGSLVTTLREKTKPTIVMMQCVESLTSRYPYCSRVCCAQALGNALEVKSLLPHSEIVVLGGEMLAHGAEETAYQKALERRIRFIRYSGTDRPEVGEEGRKLQVRVHDADIGRGLVIYPDLLVLSTGIAPAQDNPELARILNDRLSTDGFFMEAHPRLRPVDSHNEGEFLCGCARSPQFIREAVADARAAAARAASILAQAGTKSLGHL